MGRAKQDGAAGSGGVRRREGSDRSRESVELGGITAKGKPGVERSDEGQRLLPQLAEKITPSPYQRYCTDPKLKPTT
jgi:hypothetical protein